MTIEARSPDEYMGKVPEERREAFTQLRNTILQNLPPGFEECMAYGMIGYVVPHSLYPAGYHVDPKVPLPFCAIASQKNFIGFYHSGLYAHPKLTKWFVKRYGEMARRKLDMGKSCVRLKYPDDIPFALIRELMGKISVDEWIDIYEDRMKNR